MPYATARPRRPRLPSRGLLALMLLMVTLVVSNGMRVPREVPSRRQPAVEVARVDTSDERRPPQPQRRTRDRERGHDSKLKRPDRTRPRRPTGHLVVVGGHSPRGHSAEVVRFMVEVERGLRVTGKAFAAFVARVLRDRRSWGRGSVTFRRVSTPPARFRVALASPDTTDRLCAPLDTQGIYSCHQGGRAVLNFMRWRRGASSYRGELDRYRIYLVNHETGHALGHSAHRGCPASGVPAPVMMQQTMGVAPCKPNPWPLGPERDVVF